LKDYISSCTLLLLGGLNFWPEDAIIIMYEIKADGSIVFKNKNKEYIFEKQNYETHCKRHPRIKTEKGLKEVDETICSPECITWGPKIKCKENFYRTYEYKMSGNKRTVRYWKVIIFKDQDGKNTIATAFDDWSFDFYILHYLEKNNIIWKDSSSSI
jgi:hypothetical protein